MGMCRLYKFPILYSTLNRFAMNFLMSHPFELGEWVGGQVQYEILGYYELCDGRCLGCDKMSY